MSRVDGPVELFKLTGDIIRESERAVLLLFSIDPDEGGDGETRSEWFPLSQVTKIKRDHNTSGNDEVTVARWLIIKKELI